MRFTRPATKRHGDVRHRDLLGLMQQCASRLSRSSDAGTPRLNTAMHLQPRRGSETCTFRATTERASDLAAREQALPNVGNFRSPDDRGNAKHEARPTPRAPPAPP